METLRANMVTLGYYVTTNLLKVMAGSALIGFGVATLQQPTRDDGNDEEEEEDDKNKNKSNILQPIHKRYVLSFVCIGSGLFLALPSLTSQTFWESTLPGLYAIEYQQEQWSNYSVLDYVNRSFIKPDTWNKIKNSADFKNITLGELLGRGGSKDGISSGGGGSVSSKFSSSSSLIDTPSSD
jgi:hypothetical protein